MSGTPDYIELLLNTSMLHIRSRTIGGEVFVDVCQRVARYGNARRTERRAGGRCRVNARRVVDEIRIKALLLNLLLRQIPRQLVHDCPHHLEMSEFFGAYIRDRNAPVSSSRGQAVEFWTENT